MSAINANSIREDFLLSRFIETESQLREAVLQLTSRLEELAADRSKPPRTLTREEVAAMYGVTPSTISNWVSNKKVPHHKAGGAVVFMLDELLAWSQRKPRG